MKIALISCTKKKKNYSCKASELYMESTLFSYAYSYAKTFADKIYILSAKYGLVNENDFLETYNETLNGKNKDFIENWSSRVFDKLENEIDLNNTEIIFLAGNNYRKFLIPKIQQKYNTIIKIPLEGLGIGKQMNYLKNIVSNK